MASALVEAIKVAGLVLVADTSASSDSSQSNPDLILGRASHNPMDGVNGVLNGNGVLRFYDTIDV